jgi:hypothetical protein
MRVALSSDEIYPLAAEVGGTIYMGRFCPARLAARARQLLQVAEADSTT